MALLTFEERNRNHYQKFSDVPQEIIDKYKHLLPGELIAIWETMGFGIYDDNFLQLVNPEEYEFAFQYIDKLLEPSLIFATTALGDLLMWEGSKNWTLSPDEGNRVKMVNVRKCNSHVVASSMDGLLNIFLADKDYLPDKAYFDAKAYWAVKDKLPALKYGECYGYFPALALGGSASAKNLKVTDTKTYIDMIGQAAGKIVDLEENP